MDEREVEKENSHIEDQELTEELREAYLDYAMSVIVGRALPDVRDGLKPVHRRILWAMWDSGLTNTAKTRKSANVVGEVLGRYHPHGDSAVYDAMARMTQDFSLRYPLVQGQGNFGSIDGDNPAAMRYTEARLSKIAAEFLVDIEKDTIDFMPNYDGTRKEPKVLPAKIPGLLLNGAEGIAVGMATKIPPHHLGELVDACTHIINDPKATSRELMNFIKGPDFPTGGIMFDRNAIIEAYETGRGGIVTRGVADVQEKQIVITEIPYQVNKADLIVKIANLVQTKKIEGIRDIRDESDKDGLRIAIDLKNDSVPQKVMNQLWNYTDLQKVFHLNMLALVDGIRPQTLSIRDILLHFVEHRRKVVIRRAEFDLQKAKDRAHILEGLKKALDAIDEVIATIKKSADKEVAHKNLMKKFELSDLQATAILEMRLQTLAALEHKKIADELAEKKRIIKDLTDFLASPKRISTCIKDELAEMKEKHGDERRTRLVAGELKNISNEDLIPQEETIITMSGEGYIKRLPPGTFKAQRRGGKGLIGSDVGEEDVLAHFLRADTHDNILFFTDKGKVFQTKVYEIPAGTRTNKGKAIHNFLEIASDEKISALITYSNDRKEGYLFMTTEQGTVKKTSLTDFAHVRRNGIIAITLEKDDLLKWVRFSSGENEIILTTRNGQAIRFDETDVRPMGRTARGVRGILLSKDDVVSSCDLIERDEKGEFLTIMANGFAKRTPLTEYKVQNRGGKGILTARVTSKTGKVVSAHVITEETELLILSVKGQMLRTTIESIRITGRAAQGVSIMKMKKGDSIAGTVCL
jgi:DNA gyrase subunit A